MKINSKNIEYKLSYKYKNAGALFKKERSMNAISFVFSATARGVVRFHVGGRGLHPPGP